MADVVLMAVIVHNLLMALYFNCSMWLCEKEVVLLILSMLFTSKLRMNLFA